MLWAHYADSHKGIAIGFHTIGLEWHFTTLQQMEPIIFHPINYTALPPTIPPVIFSDRELGSSTFNQMCLTKSNAWGYENEFRVLLELKNFNPTIVNGKPIFLVSIPATVIATVILGVNCSEETERCVRLILRQKHFINSVQAFRAKLNDTQYKIELTPFHPAK